MNKSGTSVFTLVRGLLLPGNIRILAFTSMMTGIYVSLLNTILQPFVVQYLGFDVAILGVLVAVGARPSGLASSMIQPFAGALADLLGRRRLIFVGSAVGVLSMVSFFAAAETRSLVPLSLGYFFLGLSLLGNPASQAMIAETVAMEPGRVNVAYSVVFFFSALPGAVIPFFVGYFVSSVGYAILFGASAFLEAANLFVLFPQLRETRPPPGMGDGIAPHRFSLSQSVRLPRSLIRIFIPFAMDAFCFGVGGSIVYGMWSDYFGFTQGEIGLIYGVFSVSIVASQYFATRLLIVAGIRKTLAFSEFLTVVVLLSWLLDPVLPLLLVTSVVFGLSVATWVPAVSSLLMANAPVEERGSVLGKLAVFRGLIAFPAPILGGLIYGAYGYYLPVFLSVVGESITVVAILRLIPETSKPSVRAGPAQV